MISAQHGIGWLAQSSMRSSTRCYYLCQLPSQALLDSMLVFRGTTVRCQNVQQVITDNPILGFVYPQVVKLQNKQMCDGYQYLTWYHTSILGNSLAHNSVSESLFLQRCIVSNFYSCYEINPQLNLSEHIVQNFQKWNHPLKWVLTSSYRVTI